MFQVLGQILSSAVGAAISPIPVVGLFMMFFSKHPLANSVAYTLGWFLGLAVLAVLGLTVGNATSDAEAGTNGWVPLIVGVLFVGLSVQSFRNRPRPGHPAKAPKWLSAIGTMSAFAAFGLGFVLLAVNAKNISLGAIAMETVANSTLSQADQFTVAVSWALVGSLTAIVPTLVVAIRGDAVRPALERGRDWLLAHNAVIMCVLFAVLGASQLGNAMTAFAS